jgi:polysaccharide biosynthesis protein PslH
LLEAVTEYDKSANHTTGASILPQPKITVVPIAVDTHLLQPIACHPDSLNIVTLGTLHYPPNADGIRWFAREVFPRVIWEMPQATLTIIGKNPPQDFLEMAANQSERCYVTGYVPDLVPQLEKSAVMVVPVRAGSGMRVRILEALAHGLPIVTTTIGLEGIDALPGRDLLVADSVEDYATAVVRLLKNPGQRNQLAENGRRLAETRYDWRVVLRKMDEIYGKA